MTDTPDPDFVEFFAGDWQTLLERITIPGMRGAVSWDRRAAYLLWVMGSHYDAETPWHWRDVLKYRVNRPNDIENASAPVGKPFNHTDFDAITHTPEGVVLSFDANKVK